MMYFAYGSNLDGGQMKARCPSARFICKALLPNTDLQFTRKSQNRKCGVADCVPSKNSGVWGIVWDIAAVDVPILDDWEGYRPGSKSSAYDRVSVTVYEDGDCSKKIDAVTYVVVNKSTQHVPPNQYYLDQMINGASDAGLPTEYIEKKLKKVKTI